jgi:hypothetical protein
MTAGQLSLEQGNQSGDAVFRPAAIANILTWKSVLMHFGLHITRIHGIDTPLRVLHGKYIG